MEYAMDLLIPILGGFMLAQWLIAQYHWSPILMLLLPVVGMVMGLFTMYKRQMARQQDEASPKNDPDAKP